MGSSGNNGKESKSWFYVKIDDERVIIKDLQKENHILNHLIKQYEATLDVVMAKFRTQTQHMQLDSYDAQREVMQMLDAERVENSLLRADNVRLAEQLTLCVQMVREAVSLMDTDSADTVKLITHLSNQNEILKSVSLQ